MATIDIRLEDEDNTIDEIIFANDESYFAFKLTNGGDNFLNIEDEHVAISISMNDIPNLIKALKRAQELKWGQ